MRKIFIGIPARMGSSRFPGKPLCKIDGLPMIEHVYKRVNLYQNNSSIFVAGCDSQVEQVVKEFGGNFIDTDPNISRPSERVAYAAKSLNLKGDDIIVVVQGDEPLIYPEMISMAIEPLLKKTAPEITNLCASATADEVLDPSEIKVVCDLNMNALYMSRSAIPSSFHSEVKNFQYLKQVCVFGFTWRNLSNFTWNLSHSPLEQSESIELNRAIEHGWKVRMIQSDFKTKSVDTELDRLNAEKLIKVDKLRGHYSEGQI